MQLYRQMSSMSNQSVTGTLCAEVAARQPPKHDCHVCKKLANTSPQLPTALECPYEKFASDRIFSLCLPLLDGGESMWISAPCPEIGPPNLKKCGAWYKQCMRNFFSFFWLVHSRSEVLSECKILDGGVIPSLKYGEKRVSSKTCIRTLA